MAVDAVEGDVAEDHVLVPAEDQVAVAVAVGQVGQQVQLGAVGVAERELDGHQARPRLALGAHAGRPAAGGTSAEDGGPVGLGQERRPAAGSGWGRRRRAGEGLVPGGAEAAGPMLLDHELQAALGRACRGRRGR